MSAKVDKQGIELEMNIISKTGNPLVKDEHIHHYATELFQNIRSNVYFDDGKPEYPSAPHESIGALEDDLKVFISEFIKEADRNKWYLILLGNYPFYRDFCSAHIHTSFKDESKDWLYFRKRLYNAQPFLAYISANSPILSGEYRASDVRLAFSVWSEFTDYEDKSMDHWTALAYGNHGKTLECRIPSAGPLFQVLGVAALLRHLCENEDEDIPFWYNRGVWDNVILYGSKAIVPVYLPKKVTYYGYKTRKVFVKVSDLFGSYIQENLSSLKEQISSCSSTMQKEIIHFYELLSKGITISDIILNEWYSLTDKTKILKFIADLTEISYKAEPIIKSLPIPESLKVQLEPSGYKPMSFSEFVELINSFDISSIQDPIINDISTFVLNHSSSIITIYKFIKEGKKIPNDFNYLLEHLRNLAIIKETNNEPFWAPSTNYLYFKQLMESMFSEHT